MWKMIYTCLTVLKLLGCVDPPLPTGTVYECTGVFICYGDHFGLTPSHGCAETTQDAWDMAYVHTLELTAEAKCGDSWEILLTCEDTGDRCYLDD